MSTDGKSKKEKEISTLADEIDNLQIIYNNGRGIDKLHNITANLRAGNFLFAQSLATSNKASLERYGNIYQLLIANGLIKE